MHEPSPTHTLRVRRTNSTITPQAGDLLFGHRRCTVQAVFDLAGEQWTHIAVVTNGDTNDESASQADEMARLRTVELGPQGVFSRPVADFLGRYRWIGIARPEMSPECRALVVGAARVHLNVRNIRYSWSHIVVSGSTSIVRRLTPAAMETQVLSTGLGTATRMVDATAATCSSFITDLLDCACEHCRPIIHWPARRPVRPWQARPTPTDVIGLDGPPTSGASRRSRAARSLVCPADVWVADGFTVRTVIGADGTTVLEHHTPTNRGPAYEHQIERTRKEVTR